MPFHAFQPTHSSGCSLDILTACCSLQKYCTPQRLSGLSTYDNRSGFSKFSLALGAFGGYNGAFNGCGGAGAWDIARIEFKNSGGSTQSVCLDAIKLLPT